MALVIQPEFNDFETVEATIDSDEYGFAQVRVSYYVRTTSNLLTILRNGFTCPLVTNGMLKSARFLHGSADFSEPGIWKASLYWKGIMDEDRTGDVVYPKLSPTAQTAPIETHPLFTTIAGTPTARLNNAQFDDQGNFNRFPPLLEDGVTKNPKGGITNYYQATFKVGSKSAESIATLSGERDDLTVGKIQNPNLALLRELQLKVPAAFTGTVKRNFLFTSLTIEDMGNDYAMVEKGWDLSGYVGWDQDIYEYDDTGDGM